MRRVSVGVLLSMLATTPVNALSTEIDTDGDGVASLVELQAHYSDVNKALFDQIDVDGDGYVNTEEFLSALGADLLRKPETNA